MVDIQIFKYLSRTFQILVIFSLCWRGRVPCQPIITKTLMHKGKKPILRVQNWHFCTALAPALKCYDVTLGKYGIFEGLKSGISLYRNATFVLPKLGSLDYILYSYQWSVGVAPCHVSQLNHREYLAFPTKIIEYSNVSPLQLYNMIENSNISSSFEY